MAGYHGFSKSNNAIEAEKNGRLPLSKWTKAAILAAATECDPAKVALIEKLPLAILKANLVRTNGEWHHTSLWYNATDYYQFDDCEYRKLTAEDVEKWKAEAATAKAAQASQAPAKRTKGTLNYLTWSGTRNRPKATECEISGYIVERGSFYYVYKTSRSKDPIFKKKVGSRGTQFWPAVPKAQTVTTAKARKANSDDINLVIEKLNKEILWEIKISMARAAKRTDCARFLRNLYMDNTVSVYISWPTERNSVLYKIRVAWVDGDTDLCKTDREQRLELLEKQKPWVLEACRKAVLEEYENYLAAPKICGRLEIARWG